MSEEHPEPGPGSETGPDPVTDARIRALLAELGSASDATSDAETESESHTGPMPPEVIARLDETLAELVSERRATDREPAASTVVPLRRRWATRAAAAAAAVIVVGAGGVAAANLGLFGGGGGSVSSDSSSSGAAGGRAESQGQSAAPPSGSASGGAVGAVPSLRSASFDRDVAALVASGAAPAAPGPRAGARSQKSALPRDPNAPPAPLRGTACSGPRITDGATPLLVRYDGTPAVLVVHPERGGTRLVEAWTCGGDRRLASATVPATTGSSGRSSPGGPGLGGASPSP